ncbi:MULTISPECIES: PAS domain S-box protein [unclassified Coleofasciculus]|uniref:PAS domain S-box protein n=1 Tax=unclassified Coleofasciculus TaxID=2692782 RepID=UPI001881E695|nr:MULTISPECIES: PAS domain S-box protein [unclassified Coleofasciculus]MBE9127143.1 PAS domain S-box protein [Coleofasciculus sp. LEGE 07081]MBE9150280.1 PAS domain S-box protein [Coleofasciculus sp. LEGE 07092]
MNKIKILVVEDEWVTALDIKRSLEKLDYAVPATVATGEEAIQKAIELQPDLILMDIILQGEIDGIEAAEQLHQYSNIPVVFLTAYSDSETLQRANITQPFGYLLKPFEDQQLKTTIQIALSRHKAIVELRSQLAAIVESSEDAIIGNTLDAIIASWNAGAQKIYGYRAEEVIGRSLSILLPPNCVNEMPTILEKIRRGEKVEHYETVRRRKDGQLLDVSLMISPIKDATGQVIGASKISRDITNRKRNERVIREQQSLLSNLIEGTTDLIAALDLDFRYITFNSAYKAEFFNIFGREVEIGTNLIEALAHLPEEQAKALAIWRRALAGDQFTVIRELGDINRQRRYYEITYSSIRDEKGQQIGASHIARDISERKQAELEIIRSRDLKDAIFNESADAIFLVDAETLLTFDCNHRAVELFEATTKDELISIVGNILQKRQFTPQELGAILEEINNKGVWSQEIEYVTKKGKPFWGNLAVKQIRIATKAINLVRVTDITEQKQAQDKIQASLKEKEVLLKEIHHRVKNNLQIVKSLLQMQCRRTKQQEVILVLQDSQNRIASIALVHEKLYRSDDLANIDFTQYIPDLTTHLFDTYNISSNAVTLNINVDNIFLEIDTAIPCGLIINELVSNSLKYAFPNNRKGEIQVKFYTNSDHTMTLIVRDNGIGIPTEFDIETTSSLGLMLVQGLVEQLDGTLEISRSQGTEFQITLPETST